MTPDDVRLIERIQQATRGARVLLCTLARRGKALERSQPERAAFLLVALRPHPLYKAGRLAFDMLEIEDLMLDGLAVDPLTDFQLTRMLSAVAGRGYDLADVFLRFGSNGRDGDGAPDAPCPRSGRRGATCQPRRMSCHVCASGPTRRTRWTDRPRATATAPA